MTADAALQGDLSRRVDLYFSRRGVADVTWDANWNVVHIQAQGLHTSESRAVLDSAIRAMTDHKGSRWLVDGRDIKAIKQSHQEWITEDLLPRALAAGLRVAAIVVPKRRRGDDGHRRCGEGGRQRDRCQIFLDSREGAGMARGFCGRGVMCEPR